MLSVVQRGIRESGRGLVGLRAVGGLEFRRGFRGGAIPIGESGGEVGELRNRERDISSRSGILRSLRRRGGSWIMAPLVPPGAWEPIGLNMGIGMTRRMQLRNYSTETTDTTALPPLPFFRALQNHPKDKTAIIDYIPSTSTSKDYRPTSYTYGTLVHDVSLGRSRLLELAGKSGGDLDGARIAFLVPNSYQYAVTLLAIWAAGGIAVPLCMTHPVMEMVYVVKDSGAEVVLGTKEVLGKVEEVVEVVRREREEDGAVRVAEVEGLFATGEEEGVSSSKWLGANSEDEQNKTSDWFQKKALIIYTSGTTSLPKGVVSTHLNLSTQATSLSTAWKYSSTDHLLHILPLHHVHGILNCTLVPLLAGATIEYLPLPFNPELILHRLAVPYLPPPTTPSNAYKYSGLSTEKITLFMAVPTIYTRIISTYHSENTPEEMRSAVTMALSKLRLTVSGSAALPSSVRSAWGGISQEGTLLERYGMTEIGMAVSCGLRNEERPEGAVGWVLPGYEVGLLRVTEGSSSPVSQEEGGGGKKKVEEKYQEGEILIRGPGVFTTYWNRPLETTQKEFLPRDFTPDVILSSSSTSRSPFPALPSIYQAPFASSHSLSLSPSTYPWFRTGDFARLSHPSQNHTQQPYIQILGRLSTDIIKSGGEKLSALEIEREILLLPTFSITLSSDNSTSSDNKTQVREENVKAKVKEVAVVGLPSAKWGEVAAAVVVVSITGTPSPSSEKTNLKLEQQIQSTLKQALKETVAPYKVPKIWKITVFGDGEAGEGTTQGLKRNAMGKVNKKALVKEVFVGWREEEN